MEQGFPPGRVWESVSSAVVVTHILLLPLIGVMAYLAVRTMRRPANNHFAKIWGLTLAVFVGIGLWLVLTQALRIPREKELVFESYLAIAVLIGLVAMQVCDFRSWRLSKSGLRAFVLSSAGGVGRCILIAIGAFAVSIPLTMFFPAPSMAREPSRFSQCRNTMKQLGLAMQEDIKANNGKWSRASTGQFPMSWRVRFLPFLDNASLRTQYDDQLAWDDRANEPVAQTQFYLFACPANPHLKDERNRLFTSYVMVTGPETAVPADRDLREDDIRDGLSNTAVFVEAVGLNVVWTEPRDADVTSTPIGINLNGSGKTDSPGLMSSYHSNGRANMTMADGSVRTINQNIAPRVLRSLITIDGGEPQMPEE